MADPRVIILGGGPAGAGGAFALRRRNLARVTLIEQQDVVGGNAGSFTWHQQRVDYGSHRLHPATEPAIQADIRQLLGEDLLDRPRHGRIRLRGRWIHFPLKPVDLAVRLDPGFAIGAMTDAMRKLQPKPPTGPENFASVLRASLGKTICEDFYFPYARKIWGREPEDLSAIQARRRVSAGSFLKLARKVLNAVPGMKPPGAGRFFYPRRGYGQISEAYADAAARAGADLRLGWRVTEVSRVAGTDRWSVATEQGGQRRTDEADQVWSTLPISLLARMVKPEPPDEVKRASGEITYRAMLLIYLQLDVDRFTEFDAHYLPGADIRITRLSEPKNYSDLAEPRGHTTLCAELPCAPDDDLWRSDDAALGKLVADDLARVGLPLARPPVDVMVKRLRHAYPIYLTGYERPFGVLDAWADSMPGLLTYGRQGLFAHDNTHHALFMANAAADCLRGGRFDMALWHRYRETFATHVVED